jgi:hypothetical protein
LAAPDRASKSGQQGDPAEYPREQQRQELAADFLPAVLRGREEGTRAVAADSQPDIAALADDLSRVLVESVPAGRAAADLNEER